MASKIKKDELSVGMRVTVQKNSQKCEDSYETGIVVSICGEKAIINLPNHSNWNITLRDDGFWGGNCDSFYTTTDEITKVNEMELKDIKSSNLKEATAQVNKDLMNEEIDFAKREYRRAKDAVDNYDRQIKNLEDQKKIYLEILAKFK